jgi:hypothetical protein
MSTTHEFYRTRAEESRRDAAAATLDNVRARHLTAAAAWDAMAERGERTERKRFETEAIKAAAHADAAAADPLSGEPPRLATPEDDWDVD